MLRAVTSPPALSAVLLALLLAATAGAGVDRFTYVGPDAAPVTSLSGDSGEIFARTGQVSGLAGSFLVSRGDGREWRRFAGGEQLPSAERLRRTPGGALLAETTTGEFYPHQSDFPLYESDDGGLTWTELDYPGAPKLFLTPEWEPGSWYAWIGDRWREDIATRPPGCPAVKGSLGDVSDDGAADYLPVELDVVRSTDGGRTWQWIACGAYLHAVTADTTVRGVSTA